MNIVASHPQFLDVVSNVWHKQVSGSPMASVWYKLQNLKTEIKGLHVKHFSKTEERIAAAYDDLEQVQALLAHDPIKPDLCLQEAQAIKKVRHWLHVEESILKQKSREQWVKLGDSNSKFFYATMKQRQAQNRIDAIQTDSGEIVRDPCLIENEVVRFYTALMGSRAAVLPAVDLVTVRSGPILSHAAQLSLIAPVSEKDIDEAMLSINPVKAPGIDGFNGHFFRTVWHIIKSDVYAAVHYFFESGCLDKTWNCATITLVPKIAQPQMVKDFRPIACCTFLYKILSKIWTSRLAKVIGEVVNEAQAGFLPGKHIGDKILLATELMKGYTHKHFSPRCMIKVDLRKAYDSLEWSFLEEILGELGFPMQFVRWIMACVKTVNYSVLINGAPSKPFSAKKGLRQGDPVSPFLFAIGMEYLSRCLAELQANPDFNYHPKGFQKNK